MLVRICLHFMHLNSLQESLSFPGYLLVLHRNHLVEINRTILFALLEWILLVNKPARAAAKRLHVVPGAQLVIQCLQLILDLGVVLARPWVLFRVPRHVIQYVPFDW